MRLNTAVILFFLLFPCLFCGKRDQVTPSDKEVSGKVQEKKVSTAVVEVIDGVKHVHNTASKWRGEYRDPVGVRPQIRGVLQAF